jgi:AsmA protein
MTKLLRIVGIVIAALLVLIAAAALILPQVIDPNNYRDRIAAAVKEKTGRELTIAGDIGWSVFPWLGVEVGDTQLSNAAGFGDEPFARVAAMQVRVKLLPLLRKEVEMSTLVLDGLHVNLGKDKTGRTNWADLVPAETAAAKPKEPAEGLPVAALAIGGVTIRDASLVWDDRQAGSRQQIDKLNLNIGEIRPGQPVDVAVDFTARSGKPETIAQVKLAGQLALSESLQRIDVPDLTFSVAAQGEGLPGGRLDADLSSRLAVDLDKQTLELENLVMNALGLKLHGQAHGAGISGDAPQFSGTLKLDEFAPRDLLKRLGQTAPEVSDSAVLGKAAAEFGFKAGSKSAQVSNLKLRMDDSNITGTLGVNDFAAPAVRFNLALDAIDLDRYLPPRKEGEVKAAPTPAEAAAGGAAALPVDTLRGLNLNGTLKIGQLKAYQMRSTDISVTLAAKNGLVRVHPASAKMYQGSYNGDITLDVRGKEPRYALNEKVSGVQAGPMLTDMLGEAKVTGTANIAVKINAAGNEPAAVRRSMNGNASFAFTDGTVKGMNVLGDIRKAYAVLRGRPAPADTGDQTDFSALIGTATITNGLVRNDDLRGKSPLMQLEGKGTADLNTEALDYRATATVVDALEGQGELTGRPIPVRITGTFDKPKVGVDMQSVLTQEIKQRVEEKVQEKVQKQLDEKVQDKLKGLFNR